MSRRMFPACVKIATPVLLSFFVLLTATCGGGGGSGSDVPPQQVTNISGLWNYTSTGSVTLKVGSQSETENLSGSGTITINQSGANINWIEPNLNESRSGTITGNTVSVSGKFVVPLTTGVEITQNTYTATGAYSFSISNNVKTERIELDGTGKAAGRYEGMNWTATGTDHSILTRVAAARASVYARIVQVGPVKNEGYKLQLIAEGTGISSGTVTGPDIGTLVLQESCPWKTSNCWVATQTFGSSKPAPGSSYQFILKYSDGQSETLSAKTYDLGVGFPTLIDPTNGEDVDTFQPLFLWSPPAWGCVSQYRLIVSKTSANRNIWSVAISPTATSAKYNFNLGASENLALGESYNWRLLAYDDCANQHQGYDNYTEVSENFRLSQQGVTQKAMVSVRIQRKQEGYYLDFIANYNPDIPISSATVSGPDVPNLNLSKFCWLEGCDWHTSQFFGQTKPTPGTEYTFSVSYEDGTNEVLKDSVSDLGVGFPVPISPANGATVPTQTPSFSWNHPAFGCVAWYHLIVNDSMGSTIWAPHLTSATTTVMFDFDGRSTQTLTHGGVYNWTISAFDDCSNTNDGHDNFSSASGGSFTVQ